MKPDGFMFKSRSEILEYLEGPYVECLLCGRRMRALDPHLRSAHGVTGDDYRARLGIPYGVGLVCSELSRSKSEATLESNKRNPTARAARMAALEDGRTRLKGAHHRDKPKYWKDERTKWLREDWMRLGEKVMLGHIMAHCDADGDTPPSNGVNKAFQQWPGLRSWWAQNVEPKAITSEFTKRGR